MKFEWTREANARWDAEKQRIVGGQPSGIFEVPASRSGESLPGEWWRVSEDGQPVGYAWMDRTWDGAEILLAVDPTRQKHGVGTFILDQLEREAKTRGLNQLYNVVRETHPDRIAVTRWLISRGFKASDDGELKRPVNKKR